MDSPTNDIRYALALTETSQVGELPVGVGFHTPGVLRQGGQVTGMAVHIGGRLGALAYGDEVLVSQTVHDMVIGSQRCP